ncbi:MAG TPA: AMP-binding protein, partial [Candidatus Melainabacteria bacterium]|nr:AMP-binding protein [Candidatus Melainabacteria bacterium]
QATGLKARIRDWALKQKAPGFKRWVADLLVFRKIRAGLGGRVRLLLSGGAAIAEDILTFFELAGFSLRQGYGLTETAGAASVNTLDNNKVGSVGKVLDCVEVRIEPIEGVEGKSGIIWLKGATVTPGYWNLPEDNAKSFKEGWFNTGDIGFVDEDGYLWIPLIEFVVPVGDARPFIGALFFLSREVAHKILTGAGEAVPAGADAAFYANHPLIQAKVAEAVTEANKEFERWETIKQYTIVPVEATVDNGLMTTKRTIKTEQVMGRYNDLVEELYTRKRPS